MITKKKLTQEPFLEEIEITAISFFISILEYEDIVRNFAYQGNIDELLESAKKLPKGSLAQRYCAKLLSVPNHVRESAILGAYDELMDFLKSINKIKYYLCSTKEQLDMTSNSIVMKSTSLDAIKKEYKRQFKNSIDDIYYQIEESF